MNPEFNFDDSESGDGNQALGDYHRNVADATTVVSSEDDEFDVFALMSDEESDHTRVPLPNYPYETQIDFSNNEIDVVSYLNARGVLQLTSVALHNRHIIGQRTPKSLFGLKNSVQVNDYVSCIK